MRVPNFLQGGYTYFKEQTSETIQGMTDDISYWKKLHKKLRVCSSQDVLALYFILESNGACRRHILNRIYARFVRVRQDAEMVQVKKLFPRAVFKGRDGRLWTSRGEGTA